MGLLVITTWTVLLFGSGFSYHLQTNSRISATQLKIQENTPAFNIRILSPQMSHNNKRLYVHPKESIFSEDYWKSKDIPNKLTLSRVFAIPAFLITFLLRQRATTLFIFVFTCLTDFLDGYLARRWKQTSSFGAFLDPVADKLMVATALILLTSLYPTQFFVVPVALIMCREIGVSALREWMAERGVRSVVKVGMLGKVKTTLQMIATVLLLLVFPDRSTDIDICALLSWPKPTIFMAGLTALYVSTIATLVSGYFYFKAALPSILPKTADYQESNGIQDLPKDPLNNSLPTNS